MPGYALVLGAMLLAGLWFDRPTTAAWRWSARSSPWAG